jgi:hypothetical protein
MGADFISEDELRTFEGWLKSQGYSTATLTPDELQMWRGYFDEVTQLAQSTPKVGLMKLQPVPGEQKYAVAIRDGSDLWLTMWVRCTPKGEIFIFYPRGDRDADPHASYHVDGRLHQKSYGAKVLPPQQRQRLDGIFEGSEHIGNYGGHGKGTGAVCDPKAFDGVVIVEPGILGPHHGSVVFDLVEPGYAPKPDPRVHHREVFRRAGRPSLVITICRANHYIVYLHWPDDFIKVA